MKTGIIVIAWAAISLSIIYLMTWYIGKIEALENGLERRVSIKHYTDGSTSPPKITGDGAVNLETANSSLMSEAVDGSSNISTSPLMTDLSPLSFVMFNNVCRDVTDLPILAVVSVTSHAGNVDRRSKIRDVTDLPILAVMSVTSHGGNVDRRNKIREAYPTSELTTLGIRRVFLLASLVNNTEPNPKYKSISQDKLIEENTLHKDILQLNIIEAYSNLPYKTLMGLKYAATYCTAAQFVIKMDDDTIYDVYQLIQVLKAVKPVDRDNLVGNVLKTETTDRRKSSRIYVPHSQYAPEFYPPFLSGYFLFTSVETAAVLVETSRLVPFIPVDDPLVTGITAEKAGLQRHQMDGLSRDTLNCCRDGANKITYRCEFVAALQDIYNEEMLLKIKQHSADCYYNNNCKHKSDMQLYSSHVTCF